MRKEPWQISAARFCVNNSEKGFSRPQLEAYLKINYDLTNFQVQQFFEEEVQNSLGLSNRQKIGRTKEDQFLYSAPLNLVQKVIDHDEIVVARKSAENATFYSRIAIGIALVTLMISLF